LTLLYLIDGESIKPEFPQQFSQALRLRGSNPLFSPIFSSSRSLYLGIGNLKRNSGVAGLQSCSNFTK